MAKPNFYNDNQSRSYPFVERTTGVNTPDAGPIGLRQIPHTWIVDCGFTLGYSASAASVSAVRLISVSREGYLIRFEFLCPGEDLTLVFERDLRYPDDCIEFLDQPDEVDQSEGSCEVQRWSGYLVTGDLRDIEVYLSDGEAVDVGDEDTAIVEPALVQAQYATAVTQIRLANDDRTRYESPDGCDELIWPFEIGSMFLAEGCLLGKLKLRPGFNSLIRQDIVNNAIVLSASKNSGEGEPCGQIKLFPEEEPPLGSSNSLLEGGLLCNETIRSINGRGGPLLSLIAGRGFTIGSLSAEHKLVVDADLHDMTTCYSEEPESEPQP